MPRKFFIFLLTFFISLFLYFLGAQSTLAQEQFLIDANVEYKVAETGITQVTHTITLTNVYSDLYATSYQLNLDNIEPNNPRAFKEGEALQLVKTKDGDITTLEVFFDEAVVGKGKSHTFSISFEENGFAARTGEVWEITIPRLAKESAFNAYQVNLLIPISFGVEAFISPQPLIASTKDSHYSYIFGKNEVSKSGISAAFGKFQVFSFTLNYHLENPLTRSATTEIALPPDTAFQRLYYEVINPAPDNVRVDADGNWIATYTLAPRERIDIVVSGSVQIFSREISFLTPTDETISKNLLESEYWQVESPQIQELAGRLQTPQAIYDFVTTNLSYNVERVKPNVTRLGALKALNSPNSAICMEFTDLFVALTRAAGIPAREINGFAYTENPEIQPLSLVADVLHAWPEYWDKERQTWVAVDPTWGSTTGGVDFFNKLDLRHFTFVIHGASPNKPFSPGSYKLGPNPQKDVFVNFGQLPKVRTSSPEITIEAKKTFPFTNSKLLVKVSNPGPVALYNLTPIVFFDESEQTRATFESLPPFASRSLEISVPFSLLGRNTPEKVTVIVAGKTVEAPTFKNQVIIYNLVALFFVFSIIVLFVFLRTKDVKLGNLQKKLVSILRFKSKNESNQETQETPPK